MTEVRPRPPYEGARVLLGVTGGIASYKSAWLARLLCKAGAAVDVILTRSAAEFVGAVTFEALTGRPVHGGLFESGRALDHIDLAKGADAVVIAPATADFIARAAAGQAGDRLTAVLLATRAPVLVVPAMNDNMWSHSQTQANVGHLQSLGYEILSPESGPLAAGEGSGPGRMPEPETIFAYAGRTLARGESLRGRRVLVTAGPTREPLDPVRFISNRSSGRMGVAIAEAAWLRGATVTLIAGPLEVALPVGVHVVGVESTEEMAAAVAEELPAADVLIMAAAPADFRAAEQAVRKIRRDGGLSSLELESTPDILRTTMSARSSGTIVVGFALETGDAVASGRAKLRSKGLDFVVVNDATEPGAGFGVETNRVTIIGKDGGEEALPLLPKLAVANEILDRVERLADGR